MSAWTPTLFYIGVVITYMHCSEYSTIRLAFQDVYSWLRFTLEDISHWIILPLQLGKYQSHAQWLGWALYTIVSFKFTFKAKDKDIHIRQLTFQRKMEKKNSNE